ncbi:glycerophosphodiester phosphodiesterase [archaeon]
MTTIVGHRGARNVEPENTLLAFRRGIELGAEWVECDVRLTADGELVAMHDATLERTTNGEGEVEKKTLAELKELDAGKGEKVPTLQEIIETVKDKAGLIIELKGSNTAEKAVELVEKNLMNKVAFVSFKPEELKKVKDLDSFSTGFISRAFALEVIAEAKLLGAGILVVPVSEATQEVVDEVHGEGLKVGVWTVNDKAGYERMVSFGVDVVVSDDPGKLK